MISARRRVRSGRARHRGGLSAARIRQGLAGGPCSASCCVHQYASSSRRETTPGKSLRDAIIVRERGGRAGEGGNAGGRTTSGAGARARGICVNESRAELCAVPASRGAADSVARGDRHLSGLRGRLGVPAAERARVVGSLRPQHRRGAGRQTAAVLRRADADVRADGRNPRRVARRQLSRRRRC